jgi:hypothetical protein
MTERLDTNSARVAHARIAPGDPSPAYLSAAPAVAAGSPLPTVAVNVRPDALLACPAPSRDQPGARMDSRVVLATDRDDARAADSGVAVDMAIWSALWPTSPDEETGNRTCAAQTERAPPAPAAVARGLQEPEFLAEEIGALVSSLGENAGDACTFQLDVPDLGSLYGRVTVRSHHQVDLELRALKPAVATALRARQRELQHSVSDSVERQVTLFIL